MATTRSMNDMLNEYLPFDLLQEETIKRNFVLQQVQKDNNWKGGNLVVPFKGGHASSFAYSELVASSNISEDKFVRGNVANYKELWGTMKFNARDLAEHGSLQGQAAGVVSEQSFLRILPDTLDDFLGRMKEVSSVNFLTGPHFATATANGTAGGLLTVDHPERFTIDQEVVVEDDDTAATTGFVADINMETKVVHLTIARGGAGGDVDLSLYTTAQNAKTYVRGAETAGNAFTSMPDQLLSAANGGSAALFGETKLDYPYLQASNISGAGWTATTILEDLFDAWTSVQQLGRGAAKSNAILSYANLGHVMKQLQNDSGPFRFTSSKADTFGWTDISVIGVRGELKISGVHEMDDDKAIFAQWDGWKLCSNGMFRLQRDPEGKLYFVERATSGYTYIVDAVMFGELICYKPSHQGIVHSIAV
jgi:hypothetical protein